MKLCCALGLLWLTLAAAAHAGMAAGTVFLDANGNGLRDRGERGLAGVLVSNGGEVVATDREGRWSLPLAPGQTVFVIKPAGYAFPRRADGLPDFWRHHHPEGSPPLAYGGIAPTGALPASIDFALVESGDESRVRLALVADPQPFTREDVEHFRRGTMPGLAGEDGITLGLLLGDLVHDDLALYEPLVAALREVDFPWFALPGNHDLDLDAADDGGSLDSYRARFGPDTYALQVGRVHVLMLDNVIARFGEGGFEGYVGGLRADQFAFIANWLRYVPRDALVLVAGHIPVHLHGERETFRIADRDRLFELLEGHAVALLSGHAHHQAIVWHGEASGRRGEPAMEWIVGAASGSFWGGVPDAEGIPHALMADGTPRGYGLLDIDGTTPLPTWRAAGRAREAVMRVHAPRVLRHGSYPSAQLVVNVYLGEEGTAVRFRAGGGDWRPMRRVPGPDPAVRAINVRQDDATTLAPGGRVPDAIASPHLWRAPLPTDLAPGEHRLEIEVRDRWGRSHRATTTYRLDQGP
jgi:hypothetical protein